MARILLVDESADNRDVVSERLRYSAKHVVDSVADDRAASDNLATHTYDLMLVVLSPPVGRPVFQRCSRLSEDASVRSLPVLFVGLTEEEIDRCPKDMGLNGEQFIAASLSEQDLLARIDRAVAPTTLLDQARYRPVENDEGVSTRLRERMKATEISANELPAAKDSFGETFDALDDALLLLTARGEVLVANLPGQRLFETPLAREVVMLASDATLQGARRARPLSHAGRSLVARAYSVSGERVLVCVRDVTAERDGEMKRLQAEKLASIGMLAAGVAHEINNPSAFVLGNIEALSAQIKTIGDRLRGNLDAKARAELEATVFDVTSILQESKEGMARIQRIVRDLSAFSKADDEKQGPTEVNRAVDSTLSLLWNEVRHRATVDRDLRATRVVRTNPARLGQVFSNLILNAAQALDESEVRRNRITIRTYDVGDDVLFEVSDNGPGITGELLPRIFDSFFTTKPRGMGTGLGLPISQGIVRSLGGEITVDSKPGRGATFRVRLPAEPPAKGEVGGPIPAEPRYRRRRVLCVDDEALLLKAYRRMLADVHEVVTALGGRDALLVLEKQRDFDLILCDLQMPEMSGMELYAAVKARYPDMAERFVFVTGGAFSTEAKRFLEQAVACLNKPFRIEELLAVIEQKVTERAGSAVDGMARTPR